MNGYKTLKEEGQSRKEAVVVGTSKYLYPCPFFLVNICPVNTIVMLCRWHTVSTTEPHCDKNILQMINSQPFAISYMDTLLPVCQMISDLTNLSTGIQYSTCKKSNLSLSLAEKAHELGVPWGGR